jgi:hypothetical protein
MEARQISNTCPVFWDFREAIPIALSLRTSIRRPQQIALVWIPF